MESTKYHYSILQNCFSMILALGLNGFFLYMIMRFPPIPASLFMVALFLGTAAMTIYLCRKFFWPLLTGKIALELDEDKLQFFITDRKIYWKDIKDVSYDILNHGGWAIIFSFENGSDNVNISTKYIKGSDQDIYDTIKQYFENYN